MMFQKAADECSVQSVRRTGSAGDHSLTWDSCGLEEFLVVIGDTEESVRIACDAATSEIQEQLQNNEKQLLEHEHITFSNTGVTVYRVSFTQLRKNGGFSANGRPGIYAVYGFASASGESTVYVSENNCIRFTADISIEDVPVTCLKGLIKKKKVYSGYHRVSIKNGIPGLKGGSLYYTVAQNACRYPFPEEIVSHGGSFFVKCAENENLRFGTTNNDGIRIK